MELLVTLAVIAVLAAVFVPVAGGVRDAAHRAKTRARFAQWATAIEAFRAEYGGYPEFVAGKVNGGSSTGGPIAPADTLFRELLGGRGSGAGSPPAWQSGEANLAGPGPRAQNFRRVAFLAFAADETDADGAVTDGFGNTDITVLVDRDGDGLIPAAEIFAAAARVRPSGGAAAASPPLDAVPAAGVRAGVVFFSAGAGWSGADADPAKLVLSWK